MNQFYEIQFEIEGDYAAGDTVTVIIKSVDPAGNVTSGSVENVMVYGLPVITYNEEKGEISVNDVLSAELLTANGDEWDMYDVIRLRAGWTENARNSYRRAIELAGEGR